MVPVASAQLAVADFDAKGLAETLEGVVRQSALSSAGKAVGMPTAPYITS